MTFYTEQDAEVLLGAGIALGVLGTLAVQGFTHLVLAGIDWARDYLKRRSA